MAFDEFGLVAMAQFNLGLEDMRAQQDIQAELSKAMSVQLERYQLQMISTAFGVPEELLGIQSREITMELQMKGDMFDPFKVEGGCAHPEDYHEPLPYQGRPPSPDEWLCTGCGYWRMGDAFGVTPLPPQKVEQTDERAEARERDARDKPSWFQGQMVGQFEGFDPARGESLDVPYPPLYPMLPMANAKVSYDAVALLMQEVNARGVRGGGVQFEPDVVVDRFGGVINDLRVIMRWDESASDKTLMDGVFALDYAGRFVRARRQYFESHPRVLHELLQRFTGPTQAFSYPMSPHRPYQMIGRDYLESRDLPPGLVAFTSSAS